MNDQLQAAHDVLIQTPEFAGFLAAGGIVETLPLTMGVLRARLSQIEAEAWLNDAPKKAAPARMRNEDAYHYAIADSGLETYK